MAKKYRPVLETDGWSEWQHIRPGYRMACCDCSLVHNLELKAFRNSKRKAKPGYISVGREVKGVSIMLRAGRNNRSTAQLRRKRKP